MDVLLVGSVVQQLAGVFDIYWNSPQAFPVEAIIDQPSDLGELRQHFNHLVDDGEQMRSVAVPPVDMLAQRPLSVELDAGRMSLASGKVVETRARRAFQADVTGGLLIRRSLVRAQVGEPSRSRDRKR